MKFLIVLLFFLSPHISSGDETDVMSRRAFFGRSGAGLIWALSGAQFFEGLFSGSFEDVMGRLRKGDWVDRLRNQIDSAKSFDEFEKIRQRIFKFYRMFYHRMSESDVEILRGIDFYMNESLSARVVSGQIPRGSSSQESLEGENKTDRKRVLELQNAFTCFSFL